VRQARVRRAVGVGAEPYGQVMQDTWTTRDLPVLLAIVEGFDDGGRSPGPKQIQEITGLEPETVQRALRALGSEQPSFLAEVKGSWGKQIIMVGAPTGHARRAVGAWPTAEVLADRLVAAMNDAADSEADDEQKGLLRKAASFLGSAGRDIVVGVAATALNKQMGM
jgi:hypothetical protein